MPINANQTFNEQQIWDCLKQNISQTKLTHQIETLKSKLKLYVQQKLKTNQTFDLKQAHLNLKQLDLIQLVLQIQIFKTQLLKRTINQARQIKLQQPIHQSVTQYFKQRRQQIIQMMDYPIVIEKIQRHDNEYFNHYLSHLNLNQTVTNIQPIKHQLNYLSLILNINQTHLTQILQLPNYNHKIDTLKYMAYYRRTLQQITSNLISSALIKTLIEGNAENILAPLIQVHLITYDELINGYNTLGFLLETKTPNHINQTEKFFQQLYQLKNNYPAPMQKEFLSNPNLEIVNDINNQNRLLVKQNEAQLNLTDYLLQTLPVTLPNILKQLKRFKNA